MDVSSLAYSSCSTTLVYCWWYVRTVLVLQYKVPAATTSSGDTMVPVPGMFHTVALAFTGGIKLERALR